MKVCFLFQLLLSSRGKLIQIFSHSGIPLYVVYDWYLLNTLLFLLLWPSLGNLIWFLTLFFPLHSLFLLISFYSHNREKSPITDRKFCLPSSWPDSHQEKTSPALRLRNGLLLQLGLPHCLLNFQHSPTFTQPTTVFFFSQKVNWAVSELL